MDTYEVMPECDIIQAIREAEESLEEERKDALTATEISDVLSMHVSTVRAKLRKLVLKGRVEMVRKRQEAVDGRVQMVPAYRPTK